MNKLLVIFPGAGYGIDAPLLYYADFLFETNGYERKYMDYQNIVMNTDLPIEEKKNKVREFVINKAQEIEFSKYDEIVFLSKSIGAVEAGWLAEEVKLNVKQIFLTPTVEVIPYIDSDSCIVIGTCDSAYEKVKMCCDENESNALYIEGGNHSLEVDGKLYESMDVLKKVMKFIER